MDLLTVKEVADMLRVSTVTVRRYIASGNLAAVRVGRNIRIRRDDVERAIEQARPTIDSRFANGAYAGLHKDAEMIDDKRIAEPRTHYEETDRISDVLEKDAPTVKDEDPARYLMEHYAEERQGHVPARSKFADKSDEWILEHHPLLQLIGLIKDDGPTDMAENHDKYLAEAYADTHEEE
jgi:excisionase family DNA binding protein